MRQHNFIPDEQGVSTWVVLSGLSTTGLLFILLNRFNVIPLIILASVLVCIFSAALRHFYDTFESVFAYTLIPVIIFATLSFMTIRGILRGFQLRGLIICMTVSFVVPFLFSSIFTLVSGTSDGLRFPSFFKKSSFLFGFVYTLFTYYYLFVMDVTRILGKPQVMPFATISTYFKAVSAGTVRLRSFLIFILIHFILYIPFGFLTRLLAAKLPTLYGVFLAIVVPLVTEVLRFFMGINRFDIDTIILGIFGCLVGVFIFNFVNYLFEAFTGRPVWGGESSHGFYP